MRFQYVTAALVALTFSVTAAAAGDTAPATAPQFTAERFRAHVEFLADDLLEGRDAGTRGYDIAAHYVATRFAALGLKPAGADGSWFQQVPFLEYRIDTAAPAALTIGGNRFVNGAEVVVRPDAREPMLRLEAPAVFAGYGLDMPAKGFDDYAGLDVKGKIVVVLGGFPEGTPSELGAHLSAQKSVMAERRGAIGIISIRTRSEMERRPWERIAAHAGDPSMSWVGTDGRPHVTAPGIRFSAIVDQPAAEALFAGASRPLARVLDEAARAKKPARIRGFALKPTVKVERASASRTISSPNVVAILPGSDPKLANEYVLLMAHLDHEGVNPAKSDDSIYNGAMDNASGVATMLEVARAMATAPDRPHRSILFAAVTAEEDGLLGSEYLAKHPVTGSGKLVGVVNLDMPVLLYDFTDVIAFGAEHSTLGPLVAKAAASMNIILSPDPLPEEGLFTRSDHYRFVKEGIPSVFLMTGFSGEGKQKFSDFLARHYHQPSDDTHLPFDWKAGAKFARINYLIARAIADAEEAPRWYANNFFGDTFAAGQMKAVR